MSGVLHALLAAGGASAYVFNQTISVNTKNYNLHAAAVTAGWNGTSPINATVTINSGINVGSTSTATYAFDTGTMTTGSTISIINNGYIVGYRGLGGAPALASAISSPGLAGGPSINLQWPVTITNASGYIYSGGGGGAGGYANSNNNTVGVGGHGQDTIAAANGGGGSGAAGGVGLPGIAGALGVAGGVGGGGGGAIWGGGGGGGGGGASGGKSFGGSLGGGHGNAIHTNGYAITWVSGNTRVYGGIA